MPVFVGFSFYEKNIRIMFPECGKSFYKTVHYAKQ